MLIGYARVFRLTIRNLALRLDAVKQAPAEGRVFRGRRLGGRGGSAPELDACLES